MDVGCVAESVGLGSWHAGVADRTRGTATARRRRREDADRDALDGRIGRCFRVPRIELSVLFAAAAAE